MDAQSILWAAPAALLATLALALLPPRSKKLARIEAAAAAGARAIAAVKLSPAIELRKAGLSSLRAQKRVTLPPVYLRQLSQSEFERLEDLADSNPREALRRIDALPAPDRYSLPVRLLRVFALGNIIWQGVDPGNVESLETHLWGLSRELKGFAEEGVRETAAIQNERADIVSDANLQGTFNRVCVPHELHNPGDVQRRLGWTKLLYWLMDGERFFRLRPDHPEAGQMREMPVEVLGEMLNRRFTCPHRVMSSIYIYARHSAGGWTSLFALGRRKGPIREVAGELDLMGVLYVHEDGRTRFEPWDGANTTTQLQAEGVEAALARLGAELDAASDEVKELSRALAGTGRDHGH